MVNLPESCCMNIGGAGPIKFCDKPATHWYQHNEDICSYCDEHDYQCGAPIHGAAEGNEHEQARRD